MRFPLLALHPDVDVRILLPVREFCGESLVNSLYKIAWCKIVAISREMKRHGKLWIRIFPQKSFTKKPLETRMGKGKAPLEGWVAVIRPANILFEVDGVSETIARNCLRLAASKLPIKTKFISRHSH